VDAAARGLAAGVVGTIALTTSQRIEMRLTGRPPSDLPARVAEGLLGIRTRGRTREAVAFATHWVNNSSVGLGRAAVGGLGVRGGTGVAATFVIYIGGGSLLFHRLDLMPPPWRRKPKEVAIELIHAGVYAVATNVAYERLTPSAPATAGPA
jgi:hypothetical protein